VPLSASLIACRCAARLKLRPLGDPRVAAELLAGVIERCAERSSSSSGAVAGAASGAASGVASGVQDVGAAARLLLTEARKAVAAGTGRVLEYAGSSSHWPRKPLILPGNECTICLLTSGERFDPNLVMTSDKRLDPNLVMTSDKRLDPNLGPKSPVQSPSVAAVGSAAVGAATVGAATVGSAAVGAAVVGSAAVGAAAVGAAAVGRGGDDEDEVLEALMRSMEEDHQLARSHRDDEMAAALVPAGGGGAMEKEGEGGTQLLAGGMRLVRSGGTSEAERSKLPKPSTSKAEHSKLPRPPVVEAQLSSGAADAGAVMGTDVAEASGVVAVTSGEVASLAPMTAPSSAERRSRQRWSLARTKLHEIAELRHEIAELSRRRLERAVSSAEPRWGFRIEVRQWEPPRHQRSSSPAALLVHSMGALLARHAGSLLAGEPLLDAEESNEEQRRWLGSSLFVCGDAKAPLPAEHPLRFFLERASEHERRGEPAGGAGGGGFVHGAPLSTALHVAAPSAEHGVAPETALLLADLKEGRWSQIEPDSISRDSRDSSRDAGAVVGADAASERRRGRELSATSAAGALHVTMLNRIDAQPLRPNSARPLPAHMTPLAKLERARAVLVGWLLVHTGLVREVQVILSAATALGEADVRRALDAALGAPDTTPPWRVASYRASESDAMMARVQLVLEEGMHLDKSSADAGGGGGGGGSGGSSGGSGGGGSGSVASSTSSSSFSLSQVRLCLEEVWRAADSLTRAISEHEQFNGQSAQVFMFADRLLRSAPQAAPVRPTRRSASAVAERCAALCDEALSWVHSRPDVQKLNECLITQQQRAFSRAAGFRISAALLQASVVHRLLMVS
jgi:hypothetical protein